MTRAITAVLVALALAPAAAAAPPDAIRSGGPSAPADAKVAVVLSARPLAGKAFSVRSAAGKVVLRGKLVRARGSASPWRRAATADLSRVTAPGTYRIVAGKLRSRGWAVAPAAAGEPLRRALRFFAINSDGREPSPVHGPSHLNDATVLDGPAAGQRTDLTGGWMDAGDMLKFTFTTDFAVTALRLAARLDPANAAQLNATADVGTRWLLKARPARGVFVMQVGDIGADHARDPAAGPDPAADDGSPDPLLSQRRARTGIGRDYGGATAAALALSAQQAADPMVKAALVAQALDWYAAGGTSGGLAPRLPEDPYGSGSGDDDMALGAVELFHATGDVRYVIAAIDWLRGADVAGDLSWDSVGALAAAELCGAAGRPAPTEDAAIFACPLLRRAASAALARSRAHAVGTPGSVSWGTTAANGGSGAVLALAGRAGFPGGRAGAALARDWLLGRNTWGASFLAGYGPKSPRRPHHWATPKGATAIAGAIVGGPAPRTTLGEQKLTLPGGSLNGGRAVYADRIADYVTSEPALDYVAANVLLLAALA